MFGAVKDCSRCRKVADVNPSSILRYQQCHEEIPIISDKRLVLQGVNVVGSASLLLTPGVLICVLSMPIPNPASQRRQAIVENEMIGN